MGILQHDTHLSAKYTELDQLRTARVHVGATLDRMFKEYEEQYGVRNFDLHTRHSAKAKDKQAAANELRMYESSGYLCACSDVLDYYELLGQGHVKRLREFIEWQAHELEDWGAYLEGCTGMDEEDDDDC